MGSPYIWRCRKTVIQLWSAAAFMGANKTSHETFGVNLLPHAAAAAATVTQCWSKVRKKEEKQVKAVEIQHSCLTPQGLLFLLAASAPVMPG